jgi:hypothetical protein
MPGRFHCPFLGGTVEYTDERQDHVLQAHPELGQDHAERIAETLLQPDEIRRSRRSRNAKLFSKWHKDLWGGKHLVVVVVSDFAPPQVRHWIVTAYLTRGLAEMEAEWKQG